MAELCLPATSFQSFPKFPALCTLSTRKINSYNLYVSSAIASPPSPRLCLKSKYNTFHSYAAVKASASSSEKNKKEPMIPPYNVLITGGSKGIGYALAKEFLKAGDNVIICSRSDERVVSALERLRVETGKQHVWGTRCDVREGEDVKNLVAFAKEKLKYIDIWINNAGSNAYSYKPLAEASDEDLIQVVTTNTLGLMICCREAMNMMLDQPRGGHIFNIDGAGSDGRPTPRFAAYGATKRSVVHLTKSLQAELEMQDVRNVIVHNLSPGMVTTDLLMSGANTKQAKFFINVLAEPADVVAEYLVPNIRSIPTNGSTKPTYVRFLTGLKAYSQIFSVKWNIFATLICFISFHLKLPPTHLRTLRSLALDSFKLMILYLPYRGSPSVLEGIGMFLKIDESIDGFYINLSSCCSQVVYIIGSLTIFDVDRTIYMR